MNWKYLILAGVGLYAVSRLTSATPTTESLSPTPATPTLPTMTHTEEVVLPSGLANPTGLAFVVPKDINVPHVSASGQFTGDTRLESDIMTSMGKLRVLPYDPRETLTEGNNLVKALYNSMMGATGEVRAQYQTEWQQLKVFNSAWATAYAKVF
jgi:hypothetical protein